MGLLPCSRGYAGDLFSKKHLYYFSIYNFTTNLSANQGTLGKARTPPPLLATFNQMGQAGVASLRRMLLKYYLQKLIDNRFYFGFKVDFLTQGTNFIYYVASNA
jgi:hypothetical protein